MIEHEDRYRLESLYYTLKNEFSDPLDWTRFIARPLIKVGPFGQKHSRIQKIFAEHGFFLDKNVERRFYDNPNAWRTSGLTLREIGIFDLCYALDSQVAINWTDIFPDDLFGNLISNR